jgi:chromosome segregation ATPase
MHGDCLCDDCRPRVKDPKARIAELEAENEELKRDPDWKKLWAKLQSAVTRAEQAEADARQWADSFKKAEASIVELQAELKAAKHLNGKWMDERTTALMDKEQAEAALAMSESHDAEGHRIFLEERKRAEQAEAALADRDKTIGILRYTIGQQLQRILADLKARAEEGSGDVPSQS